MLTYEEAKYAYAQDEATRRGSSPGFEFSDVFKYAGAALVDTLVTAADSLTLGMFDNDNEEGNGTSQLLHWMNTDLGDYYDKHREGVELGSFVGGMVIPGLAAAKAMRWAREGSTLLKPLSNSFRRSAEWEVKAINALKEESVKAGAWKEAIKEVKWHTIKQGVAEGMLYEASFAAFNNQHTYMDNEYSLGDYAFGAGLGAIVGPFRWIGKKDELFSKAQAIAVEEGKGQIYSVLYPTLQGGDLLSALSRQHAAIREAQAANPNRSIGGKDFAEANRRSSLNAIGDQIDDMSTESLQKLNTGAKDKTKVINPDEPIDYFTIDPKELIGQMNIANPEAFRGVLPKGGFDRYSETSAAQAGLDYVTHYKEGVGFVANSGASARQTLFVVPSKGKNGQDRATLLASQQDLGINTSVANGSVILEFTKAAKTEHKQWAADFLNLPENRGTSVVIRGEISGLKINKKRLHELANIQTLDLPPVGKFNTYSQYLDAMEGVIDSGKLVIDPWLPGNPISLIEATASQGAAQVARIARQFKKYATMRTPVRYDGANQNVAESDFFWIQGGQAIDNQKSLAATYNLGANEEGMSKLQRIIQRFAGDKFPNEIRIGDTTLTNVDQAADHLWAWKQAEVEKLYGLGGSSLQVAKKVNLDPELVEAMRHSGYTLERGENKIAMYTKPLAEYMENRNILVTGRGATAARQDEIAALSMLDKQTVQTYHESVVENVLNLARVSGGEIKQLYTDILADPRIKTIREHIPQLVTNLESKNVAITSRDHMFRFLGPIGDHLTTLSKDLVTIQNRLVERHATELAPSINALLHNKAAATQWAVVEQRLSGLSSADSRGLRIVVNEDDGLARIGFNDATEDTAETFLTYKNSDQEIVLSTENAQFWETYLPIRQEKQELNNAVRRLQGMEAQKGLPLWLPSHNLTDSFLGFKVSNANPRDIQMVVANTADELERKLAAGKKEFGDKYSYYARSDEDLGEYNRMLQYAELNDIQPVNTFTSRKGIERELVSGEVALQEFIKNLRADTIHKTRLITKLSLPDVFEPLETATAFSTREASASRGFFAQKVQRPVTLSETVKKTLLNESVVGLTPGMDMANNYVTLRLNQSIHKIQRMWHTVKGDENPKAFEELTIQMRKEGMITPFNDFAEYKAAVDARNNRDVAQHYLAKNQSALVFFNLRFAEFAHAAVTTLSAPVLLAAESQHVLKKGPIATTKLMYEAAKFMQGKTEESARVMAIGGAGQRGYTRSVVAEASDVLADLPRYDLSKNNARYEQLKEWMTKPSDWAEEATREMAYATGYLLAKGQYPTAGEKLWISNAGAFVSRTMGNYSSRQKPTLFQGTFGQMVGLYQTFMLTMGQNLYRYAEKGDRAAIAQLLAGQHAMFGLESLPLYSEFNELAGAWASDDNIDISTTVYNVFGNTEDQSRSRAEFILFGLPSTVFGTAIHTRASLDPRTPLSVTPGAGLAFRPAIFDAAWKLLDTTTKTVGEMYRSVASGGGIADMGTAAAQGLAAQSLWRPLARYSELLFLGKSYDQKGEIVDENVRDEPFAIGARILGARPLQEQALRNLRYRASYYNRVDRDRKQKVIKDVRRVVSNGQDLEQLGDLMDEYINKHNGSYKGWNNILKTAYSSLDINYATRLADYTEKQPAISDIAASYGQ